MIQVLQTVLKNSLYINSMDEDLFDSGISPLRARELFGRYVTDVELENHSYCNRTCWFCPNSFIDRRSANIVMDEGVFRKIIGNLAEIGYSRILEWSGYAEHFAEKTFLDRLEFARAQLPKARLIVFTNGDYLDEEIASRVLAMGVQMHVDIYPPEGDEFNEIKIQSAIEKFRRRTGLTVVPKSTDRGGWGDYEIIGERGVSVSSLKVGKYNRENIYTRAGAMDIPKRSYYRRTATCLKPVYHLNVNYDGKGVLCCHTRSDFHKDAIIADLSRDDEDLFSYFTKMAPARRALLARGLKGGVCETCDDSAQTYPRGILARTQVGAAIAAAAKRIVNR